MEAAASTVSKMSIESILLIATLAAAILCGRRRTAGALGVGAIGVSLSELLKMPNKLLGDAMDNLKEIVDRVLSALSDIFGEDSVIGRGIAKVKELFDSTYERLKSTIGSAGIGLLVLIMLYVFLRRR